MKKFLIIIGCLIPLVLIGQQIVSRHIQPEWLQVTLTGTDSTKVYYIYPTPQGPHNAYRTAPSETAPSTTGQGAYYMYSTSGDIGIGMYITKTGSQEESDSLGTYIKPLFYDSTKGWFESANDSTFLKWDTPDWYTASSRDWLDWTTAKGYSVTLSGETIPAAGFVLYITQRAKTEGANQVAQINLSFWNSY